MYTITFVCSFLYCRGRYHIYLSISLFCNSSNRVTIFFCHCWFVEYFVVAHARVCVCIYIYIYIYYIYMACCRYVLVIIISVSVCMCIVECIFQSFHQ
jgi:hypothetical protein